MGINDDFDFFSALLDRVLQGGIQGAEASGEEGAVEAPVVWKIDVPTVVIGLRGTQNFVIRRGGASVEVEWGPGQAQFFAPGSWIGAYPRYACESLRIRFSRQSTHYVVSQFDGMRGAITDVEVEVAGRCVSRRYYASPRPINAIGFDLCRFMLHPPTLGAEAYRCKLLELLLHQAREALVALPPGSKVHQTWQAARHFVEEHCQQPLSREDVARFLKLHPNYLSRVFAEQGQESFSLFLLRVRLERAHHLLEDPTLNVAEVARLSGFNDANYFSRAFKKHYGLTPGRARAG